jgi:16S rRNA processing protein RimM
MARRFDDMVAIGRVVKPQGRRGELAVEPLTDRPDRFPGLRSAWVPGSDGAAREVRVDSCWPHKGRYVLKLEGVDTIEDAERFRGLELRIGQEALAALPAGSYYHHELVGLAVEDDEGRGLGRVHEVMETGGEAPVLVIRGGPSGEVLLPLADAFVRRVDLEGRRMLVKAPESVEC